MNQILSVDETKKKKTKNKASVHSILIVFSVFLIVFGVGLTSTGAYSYYINLSNNEEVNNIIEKEGTKPTITPVRESANIINIVVTHDKPIKSVTYRINEEETVEIDGKGKTEFEEQVELPVGNSTLTITAEDENGISASWQKTIEVGEKPTIVLKQEENKIKLTVESKIDIEKINYYWDEDQANAEQITTENENPNKIEKLINVLEGSHTLNITAVDIQGNETTKTQKVIGDNKPELKITTNGEEFIIKASDDEALEKIEITLNSNETITESINEKEYTKEIPLEDGLNKLTVVVYNSNNITETSRVKYTKE